jgi:glycosyltransferase involved in cell wall biosynthesis
MMKIGIDAHGVGGHSLGAGNETYCRNLISSLLEIDDRNEYHIFVNYPEAMADVAVNRPNVKLVSLRPRSQWLQRPLCAPLYARRHGLDILHFPFVRPPFTGVKTIVTVHDVNFEVYPQDFTAIERWRMKLLVPASCRKADLIFTVSEHAREQIHSYYGVPLNKIVITSNAADHLLRAADDSAMPARTFELPPKYILFVGTIQPKKNLARLARAFDQFKSRTGSPHHLVLAGPWGWHNNELEKTLASLVHRHEIHFPGWLNVRELEALITQADLFVFPSLYESFGIPPMEAQRLGVPALVSNNTCFPEIYGDSVMYCDPESVDSIADAIERLMRDAALREELVRRGALRVGRYSWRKSAEVALAAYERLFYQSAGQPAAVEDEIAR